MKAQTLKALREAKIVARERFAWPGGYPLVLITSDGGCLCAACVRKEWRNIVQYALWEQPTSGWHPAGLQIEEDSESEECCDHCGAIIAGA